MLVSKHIEKEKKENNNKDNNLIHGYVYFVPKYFKV